jgi:hypothetical protein
MALALAPYSGMVPSMTDPLSGARMKLQRAEEHFGQLRAEHAAFLSRNPYRMLFEDDPDREGHAFLWRAKIIEPPPLEKWASLIGECFHALRSALDHTAYSLVNSKGLVSEDRPSFPILDNPASWASVRPDKLPGIDPRALALIERMQPYNAVDGSPALWNVNQLDIIDKHRRLNVVTATVEGTSWGSANAELTDVESGVGPFVDGAVVGRFVLVPDVPDEKMHMQTNFEFGIALGEGEPCAGQTVLPLIERYRGFIGGIVSLFEEFV